MNPWAIVPVNSFDKAKSRLGGVLDEEARRSLSEWLLQHTLDVLAAVSAIDKTLVVSADRSARSLARARGAMVLDEGSPCGLNPALVRATRLASRRRVARVLILPVDLPLLEPTDVEALLGAAPPPPSLVLAPDRHHCGTNAMLVAPPGLIEYAFGIDSFTRHQELAQAAGARVVTCDRPGLALDLDNPQDLALLPERLVMAARQRRTE